MVQVSPTRRSPKRINQIPPTAVGGSLKPNLLEDLQSIKKYHPTGVGGSLKSNLLEDLQKELLA